MGELVTVGTFNTAFLARTAAAALEEAGITAHLADENITTSMGPGTWLVVRLCVPAEDAARAVEIVERIHDEIRRTSRVTGDDSVLGIGEPADGLEPDEDVCLDCGADFPEDVHACPQCGWTFA